MKKIMYIGLVFMLIIIGVTNVSAKHCQKYEKKANCTANKNCLWDEGTSSCRLQSCSTASGKSECENSQNPACVWNSKYKFCSATGLVYVACGSKSEISSVDAICAGKVGNSSYDIPIFLPRIISFFVNALKIATPIILIFVGMISLVKAIASSNEEDIKKSQNSLVKKILIAVMVFFIISITQFVINKVSDSDRNSANGCLECFLNNKCEPKYYRDGPSGNTCVLIP